MAKADLLQAMREQANPTRQTSAASRTPAKAKSAARSAKSAPVPSRAGKRQVAAYFPPNVQKQLKLLTIEHDTTVQGLLAEALNDLFAKYGKPEIAPTSGG